MDRRRRSFQPEATELESKILLSLTATPAPETAEVTRLSDRSGTTPAVAITDTVQGRYFAAEDNRAADAPLHVQLNGSGRVSGIGKAKLSGSLDLGGVRVAGLQEGGGTVTPTNRKGEGKPRRA